MKGLFINRSGIAIEAQHAEGYTRPAPHHPTLTPGFAGKLKYTSTRYFDVASGDASDADKAKWEAGIKGDIDTWGWYQDAGDWDTYFTHATIPASLLTLYEQHPDHFSDGELKIPESGNGIPDVVDEARWYIRFYHRTRHAILDKGYGTGGVGGARVMGDLWGGDLPDGLVAGSWQDTKRQWIVSGEDPWTTYRYAALSAHLALVLQSIGKPDPEGIDWKAEALAAYEWAGKNTRSTDDKQQGFDLRQVRMHAEVALLRLTGDAKYHDAFKADFAVATEKYDDGSRYWELLYPRAKEADAAIVTKVLGALEAHAVEELASPLYDRATRWGGNFYMPMFLGHGTTPLIGDSVLALDLLKTVSADRLTAMKNRAYTTADYFLGTNPLNMTWISRLGPRWPRPFHLDGFTTGDAYPPMGLIPYGPLGTARDWMGNPAPGPWGANWANNDLYPADIEQWPGHERWFDQRTAIASCEFTIHQNTVVSAVVYGSLLDKPSSTPSTGGDAGVGPDGGVLDPDGGVSPNGDTPSSGSDDGGCGCRVGPKSASWPALAGLLLLALRRRRQRRVTTTPS
jgi:MYXO-CTERM domain-containing protein